MESLKPVPASSLHKKLDDLCAGVKDASHRNASNFLLAATKFILSAALRTPFIWILQKESNPSLPTKRKGNGVR